MENRSDEMPIAFMPLAVVYAAMAFVGNPHVPAKPTVEAHAPIHEVVPVRTSPPALPRR
jgi:hypothetical protein